MPDTPADLQAYLGRGIYHDLTLERLQLVMKVKRGIFIPRKSNPFPQHSVPLALVGAVGSFMAFMMLAVREILPIPCAVLVVPLYSLVVQVYFVTGLQGIQVWSKAHSCSPLAILPIAMGSSDTKSQNSNPNLEEQWITPQTTTQWDRTLLGVVALFSVPLMLCLVYFICTSKMYGFRSRSLWCDITWEVVPLCTVLVAVVLVMLPLILWQVRTIDNDDQLRQDLGVVTLSIALMLTAYVTLTLVVPKASQLLLRGTFTITLNMLTIQGAMVDMSLLRWWRQSVLPPPVEILGAFSCSSSTITVDSDHSLVKEEIPTPVVILSSNMTSPGKSLLGLTLLRYIFDHPV
ncbi:hypothetical protein IWQ61_004603 [Dispira simplex]|nr:hypothetical protein IWQ61_004603 [Dispira simplex]